MSFKCPKCEKEVSPKAEVCPHCGFVPTKALSPEQIVAAETKTKKWNPIDDLIPAYSKIPSIGLWIAGAIVLFFSFFVVALLQSDSSPSKPADHSFSAKTGAEELVINSLKAPSTAKIITKEILDIKREDALKQTKYLIYVLVDAQNTFGVMLRSGFLVVLQIKDDSPAAYLYRKKLCALELANREPTTDDISLAKLSNGW